MDVLPLLWGKSEPYKALIDHMLDTACVAEALLTEGCLSPTCVYLSMQLKLPISETISLVCYLAALHDIGKCHPLFQGKLVDSEMYKHLRINHLLFPYDSPNFRHEKYTGDVIKRLFKEIRAVEKNDTKYVAKILALHHQGKKGDAPKITSGIEHWWLAIQNDVEALIYNFYSPPNINFTQTGHTDAVCTTIMGIIILSDWIASGEWFNNLKSNERYSEYKKDMLEIANLAVEGYGLLQNGNLPEGKTFCDVWNNIPISGMRPLQKSIDELFAHDSEMPLLTVIEAPMGEGKTEAGLYAAARLSNFWNKKGIYVALPTSATSNQMYLRVSDWINDNHTEQIRLLHSMAWLFDDKTPNKPFNSEDSNQTVAWLAPARRGLLSQNAVGTVDQAMMAVLKIKYGVLRLLGLNTKVLVIDEIHAYDAYMSDIIRLLLTWCKELTVPVILLSATLPEEKKNDFFSAYGCSSVSSDSYPLISRVFADGRLDEHSVKGTFMKSIVRIEMCPLLNQWDKVAEKAVSMIENGGCLAVIVNTVSDAQKLYNNIIALDDDSTTLILFHARFTAGNRNTIEKQCMSAFGKSSCNRPQKAILVATQVVEQSLDLDFDAMISAIAPVDLLLQRMGRLHRHEGRQRPVALQVPQLTVLVPKNEERYGVTALIYADLFLDRTVKTLAAKKTICIPDDIKPMVNTVYDLSVAETDELENWAKLTFEQELQKGAAFDYEMPEPSTDSFSLSSGDSIFDDDENSSGYLTAKTRLGEPSVRIALLDSYDFDLLKGVTVFGKEQSQKVMQCSVAIRKADLCLQPSEGFEAPTEGTGLLRGMWLIPLINSRYEVQHTTIKAYVLDANLGLMIERR